MDLAETLRQILPVEVEEDGALTVRHHGTLASLRRVPLHEGLEVVSLNQMLAWDLPCNAELRERVADRAGATMLGTVTMTEQPGGLATVMLRYNFPVCEPAAMRILIEMVLDGGVEVARTLRA